MADLWTPAEIATALWLDAKDSSTLTLDGSENVEQWDDKSGNERHFYQTNTFNMPVYISESQLLRFGGGKNCFLRPLDLASHDIARNVGGFSVFTVCRANSETYGSVFHTNTNSASESQNRASLGMRQGRIVASGRRLDADSQLTFIEDLDPLITRTIILSALYDYANAELYRGIDDQYLAREGGFGTAGNTSDTDSTYVYVGCGRPSMLTTYFHGDLSEVVVLQRIPSIDEREKIEGYLAHKWGLEANLSSGHPYKDNPPYGDIHAGAFMELTIRDDVGLTPWGSGTSISEDPINTYYHDSRAQFVVLASELDGASGNVVSLSLYINELPGRGNLQDFRIRIKHTSATTTTAWEGDWTECFGPVTVENAELTVGEWNQFVFQTPFEWNGTSNLLIDISRDDTDYTSNGGQMRRLIEESNRMFAGRCDGCTLYANTSGTTSGSAYNFIPAIKLDFAADPRFEMEAGLHGNPWLASVDAGRFALEAEPYGNLWLASFDAGRLELGTEMRGVLWLASVDAGRFELGTGILGGDVLETVTMGGTITLDGPTQVHTFLAGGTFLVGEAVNAEILLVGGGGGGGRGNNTQSGRNGGGGGGGGVVHIERISLPPGTYQVKVGAGGAGSTSFSVHGGDGQTSEFDSYTAFDALVALGGGGGGSCGNTGTMANPQRIGREGGSGGGGGCNNYLCSSCFGVGGAGLQPSQSGLSGSSGHGMPGRNATQNSGAGGGGAGGAPPAWDITRGGPSYVFHGFNYASGGRSNGSGWSGSDGSGAGGNANSNWSSSVQYPGDGGSGVVIIRILTDPEVETAPFELEGALKGGDYWLARLVAESFSLEGSLTGNPWLARVDVGSFELNAGISASARYVGLSVGPFPFGGSLSAPTVWRWDPQYSSLPMLTGSISAKVTGVSINANMPSITGSLFTGAVIVEDMPMLTGEMTAQTERSGNVEAIMPMLTGQMFSGTSLVGAMPSLEGAISALVERTASVSATMPRLTGRLDGWTEIVGDISADMPMLTGTVSGYREGSASIAAHMPRLSGSMGVLIEETSSITGSLPMLSGRLTAGRTIPHDLTATMPALTGFLVASRPTSWGVMRYFKGAYR